MKKILKIVFLAALAFSLLTGCYKQETNIKVNPSGKIDAEITFIGSDEAIAEVSGGMDYESLMDSLIPQIESMMTDPSVESVEKISENINDIPMNGLRFKASYGSISEMVSNNLFLAYNSSVALPITSGEVEDDGHGIQFRAKQHWYGTEYFVNGNISITQGQVLTDEENGKLAGASVNLTFRFPFTSFSTSSGNSNILAPKFAYTANEESPNVPVHFYVFTPNIAMLLALLIIIALAVCVIVLYGKNRALAEKIKTAENALENDGADMNDYENSADDENFFDGENITEEFTTSDNFFEEENAADTEVVQAEDEHTESDENE